MKELERIKQEVSKLSPQEVVSKVLEKSQKPIITTNFRPYESAILHLVTTVCPKIKVIWCDTGYNTSYTYKHAEKIIKQLDLNIDVYVPRQTVAHRNVVMGIPEVTDSNHQLFTEQVKLEPFKRAMEIHQPDLWFTNLRTGQTAFRNSIGILSKDSNGLLKVSPFYNYSDANLDEYLEENNLETEFRYYDPTKVVESRECGLHA